MSIFTKFFKCNKEIQLTIERNNLELNNFEKDYEIIGNFLKITFSNSNIRYFDKKNYRTLNLYIKKISNTQYKLTSSIVENTFVTKENAEKYAAKLILLFDKWHNNIPK